MPAAKAAGRAPSLAPVAAADRGSAGAVLPQRRGRCVRAPSFATASAARGGPPARAVLQPRRGPAVRAGLRPGRLLGWRAHVRLAGRLGWRARVRLAG